MSSPPRPGLSSQPAGSQTRGLQSNRSYDELIREYIRAARERLEAAKVGGPSTHTSPSHASPGNGQESPQTATVLPQSTRWPLVDSPDTPMTAAFPSPPIKRPQHLGPLTRNVNVNFSDRPAKVVAAIAPQFAPQTPTQAARSTTLPTPTPALVQRQHRRSASTTGRSQGSIVPIHEGIVSEVSTPTRMPRSPSFQSPSSDLEGTSDSFDNPFRDAEEGRGLLRQASIGRSHRPVLTEIRAPSSRSSLERRSLDRRQASLDLGTPPQMPSLRMPLHSVTEPPIMPPPVPPKRSSENLKTAVKDVSPATMPKPAFIAIDSARPGTAGSAHSFRFGNEATSARTSALSERLGSKRPPPLNIEAVKEAEKRGSLTSLPDLISRALRLASNLERGKTSSRFGTDWVVDENARKSPFMRSRGSPSPSIPSGRGSAQGREKGAYSVVGKSALRKSEATALDIQGEKILPTHRRRCCGMPLFVFILILIVVALFIVAAVLVPIFLIVIPNSRNDSFCSNGGVAFISATNIQQCICKKGWTGTTCTRDDDTGCVSTTLGVYSDATIGTALPSIIKSANSSFAIALSASTLLGLFSASNLTCADETALITFNGLASRSFNVPLVNIEGFLARLPPPAAQTGTASLARPSTTTAPILDPIELFVRDTGTSNGIVFAMSTSTSSSSNSATSTTALLSSTSTWISSSTTSSASSTASSTTFDPTSTKTLNLARTIVLYIFQSSQELETAQTAQSKLQAYFSSAPSGSGVNATDLHLGSGWSVDLKGGTVMNNEGAEARLRW